MGSGLGADVGVVGGVWVWGRVRGCARLRSCVCAHVCVGAGGALVNVCVRVSTHELEGVHIEESQTPATAAVCEPSPMRAACGACMGLPCVWRACGSCAQCSSCFAAYHQEIVDPPRKYLVDLLHFLLHLIRAQIRGAIATALRMGTVAVRCWRYMRKHIHRKGQDV